MSRDDDWEVSYRLGRANAGLKPGEIVYRESPAGIKYDSDKPDLSIVPVALEEAAARALTFGASKYGRNNYKGGIKYSRVIAAALRHLKAWNERAENDPESGLSHLDHAVACLAMLSVYHANAELKEKYDDRDVTNQRAKDGG